MTMPETSARRGARRGGPGASCRGRQRCSLLQPTEKFASGPYRLVWTWSPQRDDNREGVDAHRDGASRGQRSSPPPPGRQIELRHGDRRRADIWRRSTEAAQWALRGPDAGRHHITFADPSAAVSGTASQNCPAALMVASSSMTAASRRRVPRLRTSTSNNAVHSAADKPITPATDPFAPAPRALNTSVAGTVINANSGWTVLRACAARRSVISKAIRPDRLRTTRRFRSRGRRTSRRANEPAATRRIRRGCSRQSR